MDMIWYCVCVSARNSVDIVLPLLIGVRDIYFLAFVCYVCSYLCGDCVLGAGLFA